MKTQLPVPSFQYGVQLKDSGELFSPQSFADAGIQAASISTSTALPPSLFKLPTEDYYLTLNTQTENQAHSGSLVRKKIIDNLNRGMSKVMPIVGLTTLVAYPNCQPESFDLTVTPIRAWVERLSESTGRATGVGTLMPTTAATSLELHIASLEAWGNSAKEAVGQIEEPLRFDYREALAYAKHMGLPTEFPL